MRECRRSGLPAAQGIDPANAGGRWEVEEVVAFTGPHHQGSLSSPSVTTFSRHLSDRSFPPLARRNAFPKHGLPEPCLSMPASGSRKAPRVSPFRSGCGRNDAAEMAGGDGRGRIFSEVTEKEGGVARSCPRLGVLMANRPPHPALRATFSPAGRRNMPRPRHVARSRKLVLLPAGEKCRSEARR
ncbi:hypothetical protein SAMN03159288_04883 [Rhizobium sp. NFACC06-2]|nr:hypothetical protein SAMN03159288_04883 [Rhizobium sp. NFACC06-2]